MKNLNPKKISHTFIPSSIKLSLSINVILRGLFAFTTLLLGLCIRPISVWGPPHLSISLKITWTGSILIKILSKSKRSKKESFKKSKRSIIKVKIPKNLIQLVGKKMLNLKITPRHLKFLSSSNLSSVNLQPRRRMNLKIVKILMESLLTCIIIQKTV
jgi:hypothetical protein